MAKKQNDTTIYFQREGNTYNVSIPCPYREYGKYLVWGIDHNDTIDLALNVLQWTLEQTGYQDTHMAQVREGGLVFMFALVMCEDFAKEVIAKIPREGGQLTVAEVRKWIDGYPHTHQSYKSVKKPRSYVI